MPSICTHCYGNIKDCGGDRNPLLCPFVSVPTANSEVLQGRTGQITVEVENEENGEREETTRDITSLEVAQILPRKLVRALTRSALDFFCTVARRPQPGTVFDISGCNAADLVTAVTGGRVTAADAVSELVKRVAQADASATTVTRLNGVISAISGLAKMGGMPIAHPTDVNAAELLGAFTLACIVGVARCEQVLHWSNYKLSN